MCVGFEDEHASLEAGRIVTFILVTIDLAHEAKRNVLRVSSR